MLNGDTPDVACDSYHQFERDIQMIKNLGTNSYRFSIAWPRIYPTGRKKDGINQKGLDWYIHFVKRLKQEGIKPLGWFSMRNSQIYWLIKVSNPHSIRLIVRFHTYSLLKTLLQSHTLSLGLTK